MRVRAGVVVVIGLMGLACQTGRADHATGDGGSNVVLGLVVKGPVAGATVTAYALSDAFELGEPLATATTDAQGHWSLSLPTYAGHILFSAAGGAYTEEAVGGPVSLGGAPLVAVVHDYAPSGEPLAVTLSPVSHWAKALAAYWVSAGREPLPLAIDDAYAHLNAHFGGLDWRSVEAADFNQVDGGVGTDQADTAGLLLAALSQQALAIANRAGVTPGVGVTSLDLVQALADDLSADGYFDGVGTHGPIHLPASEPVLPASAPASATALDGQTVRGALAAALSAYLQNPIDRSGLAFGDVQGLLNELSSNADSTLFRAGGSTYDTTPPLLAFQPVPPLYVADAGYTLGVLAADPGSGVAQVVAQTGVNPPVIGLPIAVGDAGTMPDGGCVFGLGGVAPDSGCVAATLYEFPLIFPAPGHYPFIVSATDKAGNSTQDNGTSSSFTISFDNTPPQIQVEGTMQVYWDERGLMLETDGGVPLVPASYVTATPKSSVFALLDDAVYKVGTRLSWGAVAPTADQLNAQDGATLNVPFIPYDIAYDAQSDSPVTSVTFSVACSGAACGSFTTPTTGELIHDPGATTTARYLMPLTSETIPGLTQITGPVMLSISVTASDAAGNTATKAPPDAVSFHVLGPPLAVIEDTAYPDVGDAHSTFGYHIADATYANAFSSGAPAFAPDDEVRLVRYLVYNPAPEPIAVSLQLAAASWTALEQWDEDVEPMAWSVGETADGLWTVARGFGTSLDFSTLSCDSPRWPCGTSLPATTRLTHRSGSPVDYTCDASPPPISRANVPYDGAASAITATYYASPFPDGGETTLATALQTDPGYFIVPPASGSTPAMLAVYLNRPVGVSRQTPLIWENLNPTSPSRHYQQYIQDFWSGDQVSSCTDQVGNVLPAFIQQGSRDLQNLDMAASVLNGTFTVWTQALEHADGATGYGEAQPYSTFDFSRSIPQ